MENMFVLLKPVGGNCNMRCSYCFYRDEVKKRGEIFPARMSPDVLRAVIQNALKHTTGHCTIAFQGGEPTLAGLDFFKSAAEFARELNVNRCKISFLLQTNGLLSDGDWCDFLSRERFLVGVSLDGTKELHDLHRVDLNGQGTFERVMRTVRRLRARGIETNILTVLTSDTCRRFSEVNAFFLRERLDFVQYIPCIEPIGEERGLLPWSLSPKAYGQYLKDAFDIWYRDILGGRYRSHRYFDNLLMLMHGSPSEACGMSGRCGLQYVAETDGSTYPCDFYASENYRIGNLCTDSVKEIDERRRKIGFVEQSMRIGSACGSCHWYALCRGGCRRDRDYFDAGIGENYYCQAYKDFFEYAYPRMEQVYFAARKSM
ncbi:MAG: radical SAM protein [Clostridiales bacterium]|jgi:uncharacterized protein|nr:radical SAM protein [Clostridiales bacterium]